MKSGPAGAGRRCLICDISYFKNEVLIVSFPEKELVSWLIRANQDFLLSSATAGHTLLWIVRR
jgi:hypothetical protein